MPKLVPLGAVGVTRNGKTFYPPIGSATSGQPFDFTDEEVKQIRQAEKDNDISLVRNPHNEGGQSAPVVDLTKLSPAELKERAALMGLEIPADVTTKAKLVALIQAATPAKPEVAEGDDEDL